MYGIPSRIHVLKSTLLRALNCRAEALSMQAAVLQAPRTGLRNCLSGTWQKKP